MAQSDEGSSQDRGVKIHFLWALLNPTRFGAKSVGDYEGQAWRFGSLEDQDAYLRSRSNQCYPKAPFVVHFANSDSFFLVAPSVDLMTAVLFRCMCGPAGQIVYESDASEPAPAGLGGRRQESYVPMGQRWGDNWERNWLLRHLKQCLGRSDDQISPS